MLIPLAANALGPVQHPADLVDRLKFRLPDGVQRTGVFTEVKASIQKSGQSTGRYLLDTPAGDSGRLGDPSLRVALCGRTYEPVPALHEFSAALDLFPQVAQFWEWIWI